MNIRVDGSSDSDHSLENDDFFENPLQKVNRSPRSNLSGKSNSNKGSVNLFGITEEDSGEQMSRSRPGATSTPLFSNDDDAIASDDDDLGFDPKRPKASSQSGKLGLFDDILTGTISDSRRLAPPTPASRRGTGSRDELRPPISRQSTDTTTDNSNVQRPKTSSGRRGSNVVNTPDPLGIFSQPAKETTTTVQQQQSAKKRSTTADWLGLNATAEIEIEADTAAESGSAKTLRASSAKTPEDTKSPRERYEILKLNETVDIKETTRGITEEPAPLAMVSTPTAQTVLQLNAANQGTRNAIAMLQQQEPQLALVAQMKQQERALLDMQRKQDAMLQQQEQQFQTLLQQQLQRQQNLEENIKLQQQRINAHIQLMLTQPASALQPLELSSVVGEQQADRPAPLSARSDTQTGNQVAMELIQIETDLRRLELEKSRLEELLANMNAKYEREIEMIESTHKKQLEVLDEHTAAMNARLRKEISEIQEHYEQKLKTLEAEHRTKKEDWDNDIATLRREHEDEVRRLRKMHEEDVEMLREEHNRVVETLQRSKAQEFAFVKDNGSYLETIKAASANLGEAANELQDLREQFQSKMDLAHKEKQQEIEARERRLADKERRVQLSEAATEEEKARLMKLVSTLEQQLSGHLKESNEENWQLRLKLSSLEVDKTAFEREREYAREQMRRDEQRLAELKERQLAESQRWHAELQEERRKLQVERIKFETEQKLNPSNGGGGGGTGERFEMEAAIECAQQAMRQADAERQRYHGLQLELEKRKRELVDAETDLRAKQEKLNIEMKACLQAKQQAQDVALRVRQIEQSYQDKLQALNARFRELAEKEAFLAEERKLLAQQRIAMKEISSKGASQHNLKEKLQRSGQITAPPQTATVTSLNVVDRLLDGNIAESMQRMQQSFYQNSIAWPPVGLDDDSKTLALNCNFITEL